MAPEYMTEAVAEDAEGLDPEAVDRVLELARDVIAIGPGLGAKPGTREFVRRLVERATTPLVIDADGLNALAAHRPAAGARRAAMSSSRRILARWPAWSA